MTHQHHHTPGPWLKDRNFIIDSKGNEVARVTYEQDGYVQANARLIAQAPAMYEAMRKLWDKVKEEGTLDIDENDYEAFDDLRAILTKVEGGE